MTDRGVASLLALVLILGFLFVMLTPQKEGTTAARVRDAVRSQVHETAGRLNNAFDAAKQDVERIKENHLESRPANNQDNRQP